MAQNTSDSILRVIRKES